MIRTIEVLFVIIIISGAVIATSYFTVLPSPREVSPINLRRLSFTTLQTLDSDFDLSRAAFETDNATVWGGLQVALSASLPPNIVYNLTVYDVNNQEGQVYNYVILHLKRCYPKRNLRCLHLHSGFFERDF